MSGRDDWQVGDLALCLNSDWGSTAEQCDPVAGALVTVSALDMTPGDEGLWFEGIASCQSYAIEFFRKIKPLSADEHRSAIIELANDRRVPAKATYQSWALDADFLRDERVEWRAGL